MSDGPNKVEYTTRPVIENKLLDSLSKGDHVAILADKTDLDALIDALTLALDFPPCGRPTGRIPSRWIQLKAGLEQLRSKAFP